MIDEIDVNLEAGRRMHSDACPVRRVLRVVSMAMLVAALGILAAAWFPSPALAGTNTAPVLADVPATATIPELAAYTFTATATDEDIPAQSLLFSLVGAPAGAAIDSVTGAFSWTPDEAQGPGEYPFSVRVSDGIAATDSAITLTVTEANLAPVLAGVPVSATIPEQAESLLSG